VDFDLIHGQRRGEETEKERGIGGRQRWGGGGLQGTLGKRKAKKAGQYHLSGGHVKKTLGPRIKVRCWGRDRGHKGIARIPTPN